MAIAQEFTARLAPNFAISFIKLHVIHMWWRQRKFFALHFSHGHGVGRPKFINVNISGVIEVICMNLCNLIPLEVKSHLNGKRALLIAPKPWFWALCVTTSNGYSSGVYRPINTKFCNLIHQITCNLQVVKLEEIVCIALKPWPWARTSKIYKCQYLWCLWSYLHETL